MERLRTDSGTVDSEIEYAIHVARYLPVRDIVRGKRVLDACCGEGYASYLCSAAWGAASVVGVDISDQAIAAATSGFVSPGLSYVRSSIEDYLEEAARTGVRFDVIVSVATIEHVDYPHAVLRGLKNLLADDGIVYLTIPNDMFYFGDGPHSLHKYHKHMFSFEAAKHMAESVFGPGEWALGTTVSGFSTVKLDDIHPADTIEISPVTLSDGKAQSIPVKKENALRPDTALYYAGFWDFGGERRMSSGTILYHPHANYRIPKLEIVPLRIDGRALKVGIVADCKGWAFDNIAKNMKAVFDGRVSIETIYLADGETGRLYDRLLFESDFDHVHFLWREPLFRLFYDRHYLNEVVNGLAKPGEERSSVISRLASKLGEVTITFAVYDHLHLSPEDIETRRACVAFLDGYTVSSAILGEAYASHYGIGATAETPDGVNRKLFTPKNLERFSELERPLVVGWAGNSEWEKGSGDDPKGFETILKPALALLASEGLSVVGHFADRKERWRPIDEMPGYYAEIDVLVCASRSEGTPNPVLEAMSCGVPIVSTVVGIVPEVFGRRQREFLVGREVGALADALRRLYRDRQLLRVLSNENLVQIDSWNWIDHATKWLHLFETARNIRFGGRGILRAKYFENIAATHALHVQVDQLAAHVASLRKSLSWRITAPLRAIRRLY